VPFGHRAFYPVLYIIFVDLPASRKTTAINVYAKRLLSDVGYELFAADRTSKEKLWVDLQEGTLQGDKEEEDYDALVGEADSPWDQVTHSAKPMECMLMCGELADFMSGGNSEDFATNLGNLWDLPEPFYTVRNKTSQSAKLYKPTINMIGATTPSQLSKIFGPNAIGTGFFSRVIFVKSPRRKPKTKPSSKNPKLHHTVMTALKQIHSTSGRAEVTKEGDELMEAIYHLDIQVTDSRMQYYYARRYEQLYRLCIIVAMLLHQEPVIDDLVVRYANTQLYLAEIMMPKALGEYGMARSSDLSQVILDAANRYSDSGVDANELYKHVSTHVEGRGQFQTMLKRLIQSEKLIAEIQGGSTKIFMNQEFHSDWAPGMVDYSLMHPQENPYDAGLLTKRDRPIEKGGDSGDIPEHGDSNSEGTS
jgi:hypothetical protein